MSIESRNPRRPDGDRTIAARTVSIERRSARQLKRIGLV